MTYNIGEIVLDKFKIDEWLGGGTYTQVMRVVRVHTHEVRTLKVIRQGSVGLDSTRLAWLKARFQLEASLAEQIGSIRAHPNLLEVYGYHDLDGWPALERQYASRGSLADLLESARYAGKHLLLMKSLKIALETADGLAALHNREIIQRDLKPSNILIDVYHNVRISDLYLAQIPSSLGLAVPAGAPPQFMNNSAYLSPEQMRSRSNLTPPSDVYSLGVIMFEMLTGVNYNTLTPGPHLASMREDLPEWLVELVGRMLSSEPEKRPWSGAIVSALLRAGLDTMVEEAGGAPGDWEAWEEINLAKRSGRQPEPATAPPDDGDIGPEALISGPELRALSDEPRGWRKIVSLISKLLKNPAFVLFLIALVLILLFLLIMSTRR